MDYPSSTSEGFPSLTFWSLFFSPKSVPHRVTGLQVKEVPFIMTVFTLPCFAADTRKGCVYSAAMPFLESAMGKLIMDTTEACGRESSFASLLERTHVTVTENSLPFFSPSSLGSHFFIKLNTSCLASLLKTSQSVLVP